jgi:hypothetical protein
MTWQDRILVGDSRHLATRLPGELVKAIITSPPYFGHRDYAGTGGVAGEELGKETDHREYVRHLIEVFSDLRRALANDGTPGAPFIALCHEWDIRATREPYQCSQIGHGCQGHWRTTLPGSI